MNILGVIPARAGSKGVKGKNIRPLNGKPLIHYSIEAARDSKLADFIISTDCENIKYVCDSISNNTPFLRPASLAEDNSKSIDVVVHAIEYYERTKNIRIDAVMLLQPTCPSRTEIDINACIAMFENSDCDSVISVCKVDGNHPARMKYLDENHYLIDPPFAEKCENQPRQELDNLYIRNGAIYLTKRDVVLRKSFKGEKSLAYIMDSNRSINIDTELDFKFAEFIMK